MHVTFGNFSLIFLKFRMNEEQGTAIFKTIYAK